MFVSEFPVHDDYVVEQEASDYVNAVQIKDDLVDKYSLQEDQYQPQHEDYEDEVAVEETPREEVVVDVVHEPRAAPPPEEPVAEKSKMSYASIVSTLSLSTILCGFSAYQPNSISIGKVKSRHILM